MPQLEFKSKLTVPRKHVWDWITSTNGIRTELRPYLKMTVPPSIKTIADLTVVLGTPLFRSKLLLFGCIPIGESHITLTEFTKGSGFVEESLIYPLISTKGSKKIWRHERRILEDPSQDDVVYLIDRLTFHFGLANRISSWMIRILFLHRHRVLKKYLLANGQVRSHSL